MLLGRSLRRRFPAFTELAATVRRHHAGGLSRPPGELIDRLTDHFLRITPLGIGWVHPSWRDAVIDEFVKAQKAGKSRDETIKAMEQKIIAIGPSNVSHHAADPKVLNVFDVAPSSIPSNKKTAWEAAITANKSVAKFIFPPADPGYHFEIKQP